MNTLFTVSRYILGLIFFVFGLNGFFNFLPPPPMPEPAMAFFGGLAAAPYFFPLLKGLEVIAGLMLLTNKYVSLSLALLAPIVVNIFLYHITLDLAGGAIAYISTILTGYMIRQKWDDFKAIFQA